MKKIFYVLLALMFSMGSLFAQSAKERGFSILTDDFLRGQMNFLASDFMEGRGSVEKGGRLSAEYIASIMEMCGIAPGGDLLSNGNRSYFQTVPLTQFVDVKECRIRVTTNNTTGHFTNVYDQKIDFFYNPSNSLDLSADMVFAGYGLIDEQMGHNDFIKADVRNKIVVVLNGFPAYKDSRSELYAYFTADRMKNLNVAKRAAQKYMFENGALGVLYVYDNTSFAKLSASNATNAIYYPSERITPNRYSLSSPLVLYKSLQSVNISPKMFADIISESKISPKDYSERAAKRGLKSTPITIASKKISLTADVERKNVVAYNVVGRIKGKDSSKAFVVGGHYDHMGMKDGMIWNGADDNASGTVGVLATGAAMVKSGEVPAYDVILACWTAEELGLIGSEYFVEYFDELYPNTTLAFNINYDMLSRSYDDDKDRVELDYEYSDSNPEYKTYGEKNIAEFKLNLKPRYLALTPTTYTGATDYLSFSIKSIPIIGFFSGFHSDYHKPSDELKKLDWQKFFDLVRLGYLNTYDVVNNHK